MDFNEIKKIKININQSLPKKQENIIKSDDNNIAYEHNNSPVDPLYWQKTSGINNQDISFGSSEKSNLNDSEFIDECITKIKFFAYSVNKTPDEEYFRQTLQNILPLGKEAVELYVNMVCYLEYDKKNDNSEENIKKENISDFVLRLGNSPDQIKKLNYLSMPNFLTTETMSLIINNDCEQIDTETIKHIIDELYKDKSKADIINLLSSDKNITNADITNKDILNVLQFKFDSKKETQNDSQLFMKVLESLKQKIEKNDSVFCNIEYLLNFFSMLNSENVEALLETTKNMSLDDTIDEAKKFTNPVTKKYDTDLKSFYEKLKDYGISDDYRKDLAFECVDCETGEISPVALDFLNFIFPDKFSVKTKFINKIQDFSMKASSYAILINNIPKRNRDIIPLIKCLKDNNQKFELKNLIYLKKYILMAETKNYKNICEVFKLMKDENGIIDNDKYMLGKNITKLMDSPDDALPVLEKLFNFPNSKQKNIYDICRSIWNKRDLEKNLKEYLEYCFTEDGMPIQKNIDYIHQIHKINPNQSLDKNVIDMFRESPDSKNFVFEVLKNMDKDDDIGLIRLGKIYNTYKQNNKTIPLEIKGYILKYVKKVHCLDGFSRIYDYCSRNGSFDYANYNKILNFIGLISFKSLEPVVKDNLLEIVTENLKPEEINFKMRVSLLNSLQKITKSTNANENEIEEYKYILKVISDIEKSINQTNISNPINETDRKNFISNILISNSNNTPTEFEKIMADSIPVFKTFKTGIPLTYSRKEFLEDLSELCDNQEKLNILTKKTGITPIITDSNNITGYNGLLNLNKLDLNNPFEKQLYGIINKFIYQNEVNTGNKPLDKELNYIIKACPEFINIIGKVQHGTHDYTLDIHSLLVLANSINNPNYRIKLNETDRTVIKFACLFHDITKIENTKDKGHQYQSAIYAGSILKKFSNSIELNDRLCEIIKNHHWLEEYSESPNKEHEAKKLAFSFRRPNDFEIAKIVANADLMSVSDKFYNENKEQLNENNLELIQKKLDFLYSTGNAVFTDYIISPSKLKQHTITKNGVEYNVIDFNKIKDNEDLSDYGFNYMKKDDVRFLVHMVEDDNLYEDLNTARILTSPFNGGILSESIISPKYQRTYSNRKFGLLLSQINTNIINENRANQKSGKQKGFSDLIQLLYNDLKLNLRMNFRNSLLKNLGIDLNEVSDEDYGEFYKNVLASKTSLSQINPQTNYKIGKYSFTGQTLINAIKKYQDNLIDSKENNHNEIVGYTPKIKGLIAKVKSFDELPEDFLQFARENNYPIILI